MAEKDVYEELANMYLTEDVVGIPTTPAFMKLLHLQFTPEEAALSLKVRFDGGTLDELSGKTGMDKDKLKEMFYTMADKGTIWFDPGDDDPVYKAVLAAAPGLVETGIWGGIRHHYDVELGKALYEVVAEWGKQTLCNLGFPFAPVWAAPSALPDDALPEENLAEVLRAEDHFSVAHCPCRTSAQLHHPGEHCDHLIQTCLHSGPVSRWTSNFGLAKEITYDEAMDLLKKVNEDGLIHTLNINHCVCNCCNDCCPIFTGQLQHGAQTIIPSPFEATVDEGTCTACGDCAEACPMGAIAVEGFAEVNQSLCIGCGVCVTRCDTGAMTLVRRPSPETSQIPDDVKEHMA